MATNPPPTLSFRALQLANEQRNAYGLRYHDYERYRKHCANRTHRLRSTLKMTHGKGKEFKKLPPITPENAKDGHLELLLLESERAWAYAQDLIAQALVPTNRDQASALRHKATARFRRAIHWSSQLLDLCRSLYASGKLNVSRLLEATIYSLVLNGRFLRYRDDFEAALNYLCVARDLLDRMASAAATSRDQALARYFGDDISPEIRYCAHEMGDSKAYDVDNIVKDIGAKKRGALVQGCDSLIKQLEESSEKERGADGGRKRLREILWEGGPVPVRNPELVDALLKVQDAEARLGRGGEDGKRQVPASSRKGIAAYDAILLALSDAEEVARKLAESKQSTATASSGTRDIHFVHAYIVYQLLSHRIQRDLLLVDALQQSSKPSKHRDTAESSKQQKSAVTDVSDVRVYPALIKLLNSVIQSMEQMRTLSVVDDNPDLASSIEARISYTKARRCLYLSRSYIPSKRYPEALALCQHASLYIRETRSTLSVLPPSDDPVSTYYPLSQPDVDAIDSAFSKHTLASKQAWFAYNGGAVDPSGAEAQKWKKPTFYNIAFNYVQSDLVSRLEERAGKAPSVPVQQPQSHQQAKVVEEAREEDEEDEQTHARAQADSSQARGGLSSLLGGWWGRK